MIVVALRLLLHMALEVIGGEGSTRQIRRFLFAMLQSTTPMVKETFSFVLPELYLKKDQVV